MNKVQTGGFTPQEMLNIAENHAHKRNNGLSATEFCSMKEVINNLHSCKPAFTLKYYPSSFLMPGSKGNFHKIYPEKSQFTKIYLYTYIALANILT